MDELVGWQVNQPTSKHYQLKSAGTSSEIGELWQDI
jgi:hypothetical protein